MGVDLGLGGFRCSGCLALLGAAWGFDVLWRGVGVDLGFGGSGFGAYEKVGLD